MKKLFTHINLLVFSLILITVTVSAQRKPNWIDYSKRTVKFPESEYLVSFTSAVKQDDESMEDLQNRLADYAKTELVNSIQVSIKNVTTAEIEIMNTETMEHLKRRSVSFSQADIVGLKQEEYYDKRKNIAYALAYAKKEEVINYYKNKISGLITEIERKKGEAETYETNGNRSEALKTYYECKSLFYKIEDYQALLIALGVRDNVRLAAQKTNELKTATNQAITRLLSSKDLTLDEVCYFMAYSLKLQIDSLRGKVNLRQMTFQNTGMNGKFSKRFDEAFEQNLVKTAGFKISRSQNPEMSKDAYILDGTYWVQDKHLKINAVLRDAEKRQAEASAEGFIPVTWLQRKKMQYIPENYQRMLLVEKMQMLAEKERIESSVGAVADNPLVVHVFYTDAGAKKQVADVPIKFSWILGDKQISESFTDDNGIAKCILHNATPSTKMQIAKAVVDVEKYLKTDIETEFYRNWKRSTQIPETKFFVKLSGASIYIEATETNLGTTTPISYIEPKLKEKLSEKGYTFTNDIASGDYIITLKANARQGDETQGIYFSYTDANVSVTDAKTGREIYKNSYSDIKGGGLDYKSAGIKALRNAAGKISEEIAKELKKK